MGDRKHIVFVAPRFSETATIGGAETLLKSLAVHSAAAGHRVSFLTTCAENHFTWENTREPGCKQVEGLDVHFFKVNEDRDVSTFLRVQEDIDRRKDLPEAQEEKWIANSVNSRDLEQHIRDHAGEYDAIILGPYLFGVTFFGSQICPEKTWLVPCLHDEAFAYLKIMKRMFGKVRGCLFNAGPERELAQKLYGIPDEQCAVVGMGMDPFEADKQAFAKKHNLAQPYVMYSGRREPLKGTPLLLDYLYAFRERTGKDVKLVLTGSGDIHPHPDLAPHVIDLGFVDEKDKQEAMAGAAAFIHPSTNESFGIVLLESWLARTPGLVHDGSAVLKWQCRESGGGLWFRAYPDFEEELTLLLDRPDLNKAMGEAGRRYVETAYAWPAVEQRLFEAIGIGGAS